MDAEDKLPLLKKSMGMLLHNLKSGDLLSFVTYASGVDVVLKSAPVIDKQSMIQDILNGLEAKGATAGADALQIAYELAEQSMTNEGVNRIFRATDGDFKLVLGICLFEEEVQASCKFQF